MRVVILGCGRTGANLARMLVAEGQQVTIIDKERAAFTRLGPNFGGTVVIGIGIDEDVLRQAGIEKADAFVAVTNGDNTNAMAAQMARDIFGVSRVVCRIYDPLRAEIYRNLGLQVFCPTLSGATWIKEALES